METSLLSSGTLTGHHLDLFLLGAAALVGAVAALAQAIRVPYPLVLVAAGVGVSLIPGMPDVTLDPDLVFVIFLPPLIYGAAYFVSLRELRANMRPIALLSIGLVILTTLAVGAVAHYALGLSWAVSFVLGAIVSPTDPLAGATIMERFDVPRRIVHILDGESLVNDGSGLVLYRVAVVAVVSGSFSMAHASASFLVNVVGGVAIGIIVGAALTWVRRRNTHGPTDVLLSLLSGYIAYLPAEAVGTSGVLAAVTCALWLGWRTPTIVRDPETRLQIEAVWTNVIFVGNVLLFLLVGLQMHGILERLKGDAGMDLAWQIAVVAAAVIVTRFVWVFPATYLPRWLSRRLRERDPSPPWQAPALISWVGMRGAVSLAAALALPTLTDAGQPFPDRDLIVALTFGVIVTTLALQGLSLPWVIGWLNLQDDGALDRAEAHARVLISRAAIEHIDQIVHEEWVNDDSARRLRGLYDFRVRLYEARRIGDDGEDSIVARSLSYQRLLREVHTIERSTLLDLRDAGEITDEVVRRIERDLDLDDTRLG